MYRFLIEKVKIFKKYVAFLLIRLRRGCVVAEQCHEDVNIEGIPQVLKGYILVDVIHHKGKGGVSDV